MVGSMVQAVRSLSIKYFFIADTEAAPVWIAEVLEKARLCDVA